MRFSCYIVRSIFLIHSHKTFIAILFFEACDLGKDSVCSISFLGSVTGYQRVADFVLISHWNVLSYLCWSSFVTDSILHNILAWVNEAFVELVPISHMGITWFENPVIQLQISGFVLISPAWTTRSSYYLGESSRSLIFSWYHGISLVKKIACL